MDRKAGMEISLFSFGFKHGLPEEADMIWDVRFLPNPYWDEGLRPFSGQDARVAAYVLDHAQGRDFLDRFLAYLEFYIRACRDKARQRVRVAVGCTGGRHRSVYCANLLADYIRKNFDVDVEVRHRELELQEELA